MASLYFEEKKRQATHDEEEEEEEEEEEVAPFDEKEQEQQRQNLQDLSELEDYTTEIAASPPPTPLRNNNYNNGNNNNDGDGSLVGNEPNIMERSFMKQNVHLLPTTTPAPTPAQLPNNDDQHQTPIVSPGPQRQIEFGQSARRQRLTPPSAPSAAHENDEESILDADVHLIGPVPTSTTADSSPSTIASSSNGGIGGGNDDAIMGTPPNGNFSSSPTSGGQSIGHSAEPPAINRKANNISKGKDPEGQSGLSKKKPISPPTDDDSEDDNKRRCSKAAICALCCCFLALIAIAVVVVIFMGNQGKNNSQSNQASGSGGGDVSPSPTTPLPTLEPTPIPLVPNDICNGAIMIPNKNHELIASTSDGATTRGEVDFGNIETSCGGRVGDGPGLWYSMIGGGRDVAVSTCSEETLFDTKIAIYTGECDGGNSGNDVSDSLACVAEDDDSCGIASTVTWFAEKDQLYYILVRGFRESSGTFQLTVKEPPPENDECPGAILLEPDGSVFIGNSKTATVDYEYDGLCSAFDSLEITAPGVWFSVVGTGEELIATTCHGSEYDTKISVFQGPNCNSLVCVDGNDDGCSGIASQVEFLTTKGQMYYVLVHGYQDNAGVYGISIATPDNLYNNFCWESKELKVSEPVQGNTLLADFDFGNVVTCGNTLVVGPSVWYTVYGTGSDMAVSLCSPNTDYDTQVTVFTGGCSSLLCVGGNDDSPDAECDVTSEFVWPTELFEEYHIVVHGFGNSTGNFEVVVESLGEPQVLDDCSSALGPLPLNWDPVIGSTEPIATFSEDLLDCIVGLPSQAGDGSLNVPGEWYYVESDGGLLNVSVCEESTPGTRVTVFQGGTGDACDFLSCGVEGIRHGPCAYSWNSTRGLNYHFMVHSPPNSNTRTGEYAVTVTSTGPPPVANSECEDAIELEIDSVASVYGTTAGATEEKMSDFCGVEITSPAVWYSVVGNGNFLNATLCSELTNYDSKVSVFTGLCGDLACVGGDDDYCGLQSNFMWETEVAERYYILVHGFAESTGDHGIRVVTSFV